MLKRGNLEKDTSEKLTSEKGQVWKRNSERNNKSEKEEKAILNRNNLKNDIWEEDTSVKGEIWKDELKQMTYLKKGNLKKDNYGQEHFGKYISGQE